MTTLNKISLVFCFLIFGINNLSAQSGTVTTGNTSFGASGNVSYSIGQINYLAIADSNGSISQGLQQPFEFFAVTGIEKQNINLVYTAYPNPTSDFIILNISNAKNMNFSLIDLQGKTLLNQKINADQTKINFNELSCGTYFINVSDNIDNNILKSFKIIKY